MKRKIMWVSQHLEIDTMDGRIHEHLDPPAVVDEDGEMHEGEIHNVISTPFGIWRVDDSMNPYKQFKLWMGHTNFTINKKIAHIMKRVPGVEVLVIITRYRFMIGVGELFNIRDVRVAIEKSLRCSNEELLLIADEDLKTQIKSLQEKLAVHDKWAIYVFPNGTIDFVTDEVGVKQFSEKLLVYKNAVDHSSGILIENCDD
jgi:hypothetical protein